MPAVGGPDALSYLSKELQCFDVLFRPVDRIDRFRQCVEKQGEVVQPRMQVELSRNSGDLDTNSPGASLDSVSFP